MSICVDRGFFSFLTGQLKKGDFISKPLFLDMVRKGFCQYIDFKNPENSLEFTEEEKKELKEKLTRRKFNLLFPKKENKE